MGKDTVVWRDPDRVYYEDEMATGCYMCGDGEFYLMSGSDYMWKCGNCEHIGHFKVKRRPLRKGAVNNVERKSINAESKSINSTNSTVDK